MSMQDDKHQERIEAKLYYRHSSEFYDYHAKRGDVKFYVDLTIKRDLALIVFTELLGTNTSGS